MSLKQPLSLTNIASQFLGRVIAGQALHITKENNLVTGINTSQGNINLELNFKSLAKFYDDSIPQCLHNIVTYHTLNSLKNVTSSYFEITQNDLNVSDLVLRRHITKFNFLDWPTVMHCMLHMSLPKLNDLKFLYLDLLYMKDGNLNYILKGIEGMKQLETFICHYCRDDIIKVLCKSCPLIYLDISFSECFDDKDIPIRSLLKLQNLKTLNILGTKVSKEGQKRLLLGLPNLKKMWYRELHLLLAELDDSNATSLEDVKYLCYDNCDVTNLIKFCPSIKKLEIHQQKSSDLSDVGDLQYLTNLTVTCDFYKSNVLTILDRRGCQLTELGIHCDNVSLITLYIIDASCPNLVKFSLNCVSFDDEDVEFPMDEKVFQNLEYFSNTAFTPNNITACLIFFMCNCIKIKEVEFLSALKLRNRDIDLILAFNPLVNLQNLYLESHDLTVKSVYKLLTSCKQLRRIGCKPLSHWRRITESKINKLRNCIRTNNLNVEIINSWGDRAKQSVML